MTPEVVLLLTPFKAPRALPAGVKVFDTTREVSYSHKHLTPLFGVATTPLFLQCRLEPLSLILDEVWGAQCCTEVRPAIGSDVDSGVSEDCLCIFQVLVLGHQPGFYGVGEIAIAWAFSCQSVPPTTQLFERSECG